MRCASLLPPPLPPSFPTRLFKGPTDPPSPNAANSTDLDPGDFESDDSDDMDEDEEMGRDVEDDGKAFDFPLFPR